MERKEKHGVLKYEFRKYQEVQMDGQYNMYDPIARKQDGLQCTRRKQPNKNIHNHIFSFLIA